MFYDWFQGMMAHPDSADHYRALISGMIFGLSWLWLIWLLVIQTQRKILAWLVLPVTLFMMWILHAQPHLFFPLGMVAALGMVVCGVIVARGPVTPPRRIAGGMAVIAGFSLIIIPLVNMQYGVRANQDNQMALMGRMAQLDDARFFMLCQRWRLSCGQPARPAKGIPDHEIDPSGTIRFYAPYGADQMRVIVDRGTGRMIHDAFRWAAMLQSITVLLVWGAIALMAIAGHRMIYVRGLPHSQKPAT